MDLAIRFPTQGRIHLESRFLFSEPHEPNCRQFLERVFQAPEITQVTIRSQAGVRARFLERSWVFVRRTHSLKEVVDRVTVLLNPGKVSSNGVSSRQTASGSNGSVTVMPTVTRNQTVMRATTATGSGSRTGTPRV